MYEPYDIYVKSIRYIRCFSKTCSSAKQYIWIICIRYPRWFLIFIKYFTFPTTINIMRFKSYIFRMYFISNKTFITTIVFIFASSTVTTTFNTRTFKYWPRQSICTFAIQLHFSYARSINFFSSILTFFLAFAGPHFFYLFLLFRLLSRIEEFLFQNRLGT